jgi:hypothetical protein
MEIRGPRLRGKGAPPTSSAVATVKGRVEAGLLCQRANKKLKFGKWLRWRTAVDHLGGARG